MFPGDRLVDDPWPSLSACLRSDTFDTDRDFPATSGREL